MTAGTSQNEASQNEVRVILVGRTGLDAVLRLDPEIELVRVPTALEAVAELASPVDTHCPDRSVVVVAPEVERLLGNADSSGGCLADFLKGLRTADPMVRVLGVATGDAPTPFDGTLSSDLSTQQLRDAVTRPAQQSTSAPAPTLAHCPPQAPSEIAAPTPAPQHPGDLELVSLLVRGQDILPAALNRIRELTSDPSIEFIPEASPQSCPVSWEGSVLGHLRAQRPADVEPHTRWLAGWLRLRDQQAQLRAAAFTDPLTGAYNRRYFDRFLASAIEQAREARRSVTLMVFDIDDFKSYNDRYGHDAGDDILRETVKLMRSVIRPTDKVCRIGGDEFAVVFYEPQGPRQEGSRHPDSVFTIAQRFQEQVQQHKFPKLAGCAAGALTVSGGLATFPWDGTTVEQLVSRADQLAMTSKRQGKNAITLGPSMPCD